jgi:hypothetical protein
MGDFHPLDQVKGCCGFSFTALTCSNSAAIFSAVSFEKIIINPGRSKIANHISDICPHKVLKHAQDLCRRQ